MEAIPVLTSLLPLAVLALVVWLAVRTFGQRGPDGGADPAVTLRRLFLYGLLYVTLLVAAQGLIELFRELLEDEDRSNAALARALAFLVVGGPACAGLVWYVDRRLTGDPEERTSLAWTVYLNGALLTTLIGSMIESQEVLRLALAPSERRRFASEALAAAIIWTGLWAGHWFLRRRHGIRGDLDLSIGTVFGLAPLAVGLAGMLTIAGDELYDLITDDPVTGRGGPAFGSFVATAVVGGVTWTWYWLLRYRTATRTGLWYVTVLPIGALAGFVATVSMAATVGYTVAVWFLGDPDSSEAVRHFEPLPAFLAILAVGAATLAHHRSLLRVETERNDAIRSYDYLLALAALVSAVAGAVLLLVAVFSIGRSALANTVIAGITLVAVGTPVWFTFWSRIQRHIAIARLVELRSPLRRAYLFSIFGIGGLAVLIAVLAVLTSVFEDLLDGTVDRETLQDNRVGVAVVLAVTGVAWYHFRVYRAERPDYEPPPPPPPPPPTKRVVLVSPQPGDLARELAEATGASVVPWHRTDLAGPPSSALDELSQLIADRSEQDLLVVVGDDGPVVIPFVSALGVSGPPGPLDRPDRDLGPFSQAEQRGAMNP